MGSARPRCLLIPELSSGTVHTDALSGLPRQWKKETFLEACRSLYKKRSLQVCKRIGRRDYGKDAEEEKQGIKNYKAGSGTPTETRMQLSKHQRKKVCDHEPRQENGAITQKWKKPYCRVKCWGKKKLASNVLRHLSSSEIILQQKETFGEVNRCLFKPRPINVD